MTPPVSNENSTPAVPPYRLEFGAGYSSIDLGDDAPSYSGAHYQLRLGQNFPADGRNQFFINGVFRQGFLSNHINGETVDLSTAHFGAEAGYEGWVVPQFLSLFLFGGVGTTIYHSEDLQLDENLATAATNDAALAVSLGGGASLGQGLLVLSGAYQGNFGLEITSGDEFASARGYNPQGYYFNAALDFAKLTSLAGGEFAVPNGETFAEEIHLGVLTEGSYTYNFRRPSDEQNALRIFDTRNDRPMFNLAQFSLRREADAEAPFGFGLVLDTGENPAVSAAADSFSGDYYDLQQAWGEIRLPIGNGLTIRGGKIATIIGNEVIEPTNNQISRSWGFGLAIPFTHIGALATYEISDAFSFNFGVVNGWDNVLGRNAGPAGVLAVFTEPSKHFSWSLTGSLGEESNRTRSVLDTIATVSAGNFSTTFNLDWGHEGKGGGLPTANWIAASLSPRYDFLHHFGISARGEVFYDPDAARTGAVQTLGHGALTLHLKPVPEKHYHKFPMELRAEVRHDVSTADSFFSGDDPVGSQTTFGINAVINYDWVPGARDQSEI